MALKTKKAQAAVVSVVETQVEAPVQAQEQVQTVEVKTEAPSFVKVLLAAWIAPGPFLKMFRAANPKFPIQVGTTLDWVAMGLPPHVQFGPVPPLTVTFIHPSGAVEGTIKCADCDEIVEVHAGDIFQKRRCPKHQRKIQHLSRKGIKSPEDAERVKAEREAAKLQKDAEKAQATAQAALKKAEDAAASAKKRAEDAAAKAALIAKVAAEHGVTVSPKSEAKTEVAAA